MTEYLFAYGTLQESDVQEYVFRRILEGEADILPKYRISDKKMYGRYLVLEPSGKEQDQVEGRAYALEQEELLLADVYEGPAYKRIPVSLKSGRRAWVYMEKEIIKKRL